MDTVQFKDYSVVRNNSATWSWSFPGGTTATSTEENPVVSYAGADDGFYDFTLTVTDAYGTSSQTLTDFIEVSNQCGSQVPDTIPGNVATLSGSSNRDYLRISNLNLNKNAFTFTCWIKPNGIQENWSGIFSAQDESAFFILNFRNDGNNSLGYHPKYFWDSGLQAPPNEWSHVGFVSDGEHIRIYVNGIESENINDMEVGEDEISIIDLGRYGKGYVGTRYANLEMDEVSIWNRPLSVDEIRKWRHLTKTNTSDPIFQGLVAYYQFNETNGGVSLNKTSNTNHVSYHGISGSSHNVSTAPVFDGQSEKLEINSAGMKRFSSTGLSINFA